MAPDGTIAVFAGRGTGGGNAGEGERAQDATLDGPVGIAVLPNGEVVFSDRNNQRIKLVDNAGNLFTIAGSGRTGDGQTATDTRYGEFEPNFTPRLNDNCSGLASRRSSPAPRPTGTPPAPASTAPWASPRRRTGASTSPTRTTTSCAGWPPRA